MSEYRPRRAHKKSRGGCHQCKSRRVKCDEDRPQCQNCLTTERQCTYATGAPSIPPQPQTIAAPISIPRGNIFGLEHMSLLLDARDRPDLLFMCDEFSHPIISEVLALALERQHIMDQLLALCALRRQMTASTGPTDYLLLSAELQDRALSAHNVSDMVIPADDMLPRFVFALMLGYSHLCELYSSFDEKLPVFFGKLREYMRLVQLGKSMARQHWATIAASEIRHIYFACGLEPDHPAQITLEAEQDVVALDSMFHRSDMDQARLDVCQQAARALEMAFSLFRENAQHEQLRTQAVSVFLVHCPVEFVDVLDDKEPEALVILAHYGALLHQSRGFWAVGDCGRRLVQLVASLVDSQWEPYIHSPLAIVS